MNDIFLQQRTADEVYEEYQRLIAILIAEIENHLQSHCIAITRVNWAHVGDLKIVEERLREINQFIEPDAPEEVE